ncbi:MAG: hypothetical protein U5K77_02630 [Candidatus Saccharibacteria bacterium]|nr:hypothetical protein [Candidatus Saccharibacteria bacterium]
MTSKRLYMLLLVLLAILGVLSVSGAVYGNDWLKEQSEELNTLKAQSEMFDEQLVSLVQAKQDVQTYSDLETVARTVVPQEKDQARTVREIIALADSADVGIASISFPSSELGSDDAPTSSSDDVSITQLEKVDGIPNLYHMNISVQGANSVPYERLLNFLEKLEQNRRTAQVTNITVNPSTENRNNVNFSITLQVYIKP